MSNQKILLKWYSPSIPFIYGYMYGQPYINTSHGLEKDKIIEIPKKQVQLGKNGDCLYYVWGWPGPDINLYMFEDYGKTWAFSREEINED